VKPLFGVIVQVFLIVGFVLGCGVSGGGDDVRGLDGDSASDCTVAVGGAEGFRGCVEGDFDPYYGVLHAHTSYSNGVLTPADAFEYGRDVGLLDILVITDHLADLYDSTPVPDKWERCHEQADAAYVPGVFVADCGFEYGAIVPLSESTGHNCVYFSGDLFPKHQLDFRDFYRTLVECTECIGQFNHPGQRKNMHWNHFEYYADVDERMNLFEFNGPGPVWDLFIEALDAGWHVSPMHNQDNHNATWGTKNDCRSVLYMADLTREDMRDAMLNRRTFMTYDKNASIKMMANTECWMGSILTDYLFDTIVIEVEVFDPNDDDGFRRIELFGPRGLPLAARGCRGEQTCYASFEFEIDGPTYFVASAEQTDGDWLVAAPIWVEP